MSSEGLTRPGLTPLSPLSPLPSLTTREMLGSLTLLLALPHHGQAGGLTYNSVSDSLLLSLLDGLNLVMLGETRGFNR